MVYTLLSQKLSKLHTPLSGIPFGIFIVIFRYTDHWFQLLKAYHSGQLMNNDIQIFHWCCNPKPIDSTISSDRKACQGCWCILHPGEAAASNLRLWLHSAGAWRPWRKESVVLDLCIPQCLDWGVEGVRVRAAWSHLFFGWADKPLVGKILEIIMCGDGHTIDNINQIFINITSISNMWVYPPWPANKKIAIICNLRLYCGIQTGSLLSQSPAPKNQT